MAAIIKAQQEERQRAEDKIRQEQEELRRQHEEEMRREEVRFLGGGTSPHITALCVPSTACVFLCRMACGQRVASLCTLTWAGDISSLRCWSRDKIVSSSHDCHSWL